jgi:predicted ATPase
MMLSLREWIVRASKYNGANELVTPNNSNNWVSGTIRRSSALSSDSYFKPALIIARSLADQLCEGSDENNGGHRSPSPAPDTDWADHVVVHLSNELPDIDDCKEDLQPLQFSSRTFSSDPNELQALLNSIINDHSHYTMNDDDEVAPTCIGNEVNIVPLHDVMRADFKLSRKDGLCSQISEMQRIYNLGLIFYELFSGGGRPPEINTPNLIYDSMLQIRGVKKGDADDEPLLPVGRLNISNDIDDVGNSFKESDVSPQPLDVTGMNLMPRKKSINTSSCIVDSISTEPLRQKRVPTFLCDLIDNMLDVINGDLSREEAYRTVSDVRKDLQLMLDKPDRFLYDMDVERLAVTGLQLSEALFWRETDFTSLQGSYRRSISGENECAIIVGPSGIGKTVLANRLGSFASADGAFFLTGKFDQLQQMTPFSALSSAFNEYCNQMSEESNSRHLPGVATKLRKALGEEARHLVKVIPNLGMILGEGTGKYEIQDCANAQTRIQYLLCQFVDVISSFSGAPVVLFLDDLQWSDQASLSAIKQLLLSFVSNRQFFFLGSCREEGLVEEHPFGSMIATTSQFGVHATVVKLVCLDKDTTNTVISDLLCLSPRLTRTLSDIVYHKSQGNPLFFSQLMISLCRDGLLRLSLRRRRWEWDEELIQSMKLPDDVAALLLSTVERLPKEVQSALCTLSCFGARSDCVLIEALEASINIPLLEPLQIAVAEGIVDKVDGKYSFGHDKLQEAVYNMMKIEDRCLFHCKYGFALVQRALERVDDDLLFISVRQINLGGRAAVNETDMGVAVANLNLTAGITAMEMSDFSSAFSFFDHGINFLPRNNWQEHYDLSLQLFETAGKCALVKGDLDSLKLVSDQIFLFAKRYEDKLNTLFNNVTALTYTSAPESAKMAIAVLSQLGIELPDSSESDFKSNIEHAKVLLTCFTDQALIGHKVMTDPSMIIAMKFLARLGMSYQYIRPASVPVVTLKMIQLSIDHGMSPVSPIGFTYFGQHIATCGDLKEGCRYVNIARTLMKSLGSKEFAGEVIGFGSQLLHFVKPVQTTVELHTEGYTIAMAAGDMQGAMLNRAMYCGVLSWAGTKLTICNEHLSETCRLLKQHGHFILLAHAIQMEKNVQLLMGTADGQDDTSTSNGTVEVEEILKNSNSGSISFTFQKMLIHFMFREYDSMKLFAEKFFSVNYHNWNLLFAYGCQKFFGGLVAFWVCRQTKNPTWSVLGWSAKVAVKKWADESSQHNFQHKVYLLEAEEAFCNNDTEKAQLYYEMAVSSAKEHR